MAPKSKSSSDAAPGSPGARREPTDDEDDLEQLEPAAEQPTDGVDGKSTTNKRKRKKKTDDDEDADAPVIEKRLADKKRRAPVSEEDEEAEDEECPTEERNVKVSRDRRSAMRTGYRELAEKCGYDPTGQSAKTDMLMTAMSEHDVRRLAGYKPCTPEKPSFEFDEFARRMQLSDTRLSDRAARQALSAIEPVARHVTGQLVELLFAKGVQTGTAAMVDQVLAPYRISMELSGIEAPPGLVRVAKKTPARHTKQVDAAGRSRLVPSKETIIYPYDPSTDEKLRKDVVLNEYKDADRKMKSHETKTAKRCAELFEQLVPASVEARVTRNGR